MEFMPSGWKRDLMHIVRCFYASQIGPLNICQWHSDWDNSGDGRAKERVVEHQRTGATPLHVLCGQVLHGQHGPQPGRTWPAH